MRTISDILTKYSSQIDPFDLELLIAHALGKNREFVLAHPEKTITEKQETIIKKFIDRKIKHEPLAYILGKKEFYGLNFKVNKNVLVPRPETEQIVELVTCNLKRENKFKNAAVIDVGTGSGNIIISVACNLAYRQIGIKHATCNDIKYYATDISAKALAIAKQNAKLHKVDKKIKFLRGNLLKPLTGNWKLPVCRRGREIGNSRTIVLANLPYLDSAWRNLLKSSDSKSLEFEPKIALEGGFDGLDGYRSLAGQIKAWKGKNRPASIHLFCEIGHLQKAGMKKIFSFADRICFHKDLTGRWRVCQIEIRSTKS
jgi:release factor glutamine methyltransferase